MAVVLLVLLSLLLQPFHLPPQLFSLFSQAFNFPLTIVFLHLFIFQFILQMLYSFILFDYFSVFEFQVLLKTFDFLMGSINISLKDLYFLFKLCDS